MPTPSRPSWAQFSCGGARRRLPRGSCALGPTCDGAFWPRGVLRARPAQIVLRACAALRPTCAHPAPKLRPNFALNWSSPLPKLCPNCAQIVPRFLGVVWKYCLGCRFAHLRHFGSSAGGALGASLLMCSWVPRHQQPEEESRCSLPELLRPARRYRWGPGRVRSSMEPRNAQSGSLCACRILYFSRVRCEHRLTGDNS